MTKINEIASYKYNPVQSSTAASSSTSSNSTLNNAFMELLLAQMKNQNPMEPMKDNEMIAQMAQLNSLQELQKVNEKLATLAQSNKFLSAASLIGKVATYAGDNGEVNGKVTAIQMNGTDVQLTIGNDSVSLSDITGVAQGA